MSLDYTDGCVNFRDVGAFVNFISDQKIMPEKRILRGGSIDYVKDVHDIDSPQTIINLRNGHDPIDWEVDYLHFPMSNKIEKYDTSQKEVQKWLDSIISAFESKSLQYPVLIHCLSGKDRTGIVVAALLKIIGVNEQTIVSEYLLSDGAINPDWIALTLDGIGEPEKYFKRVDLKKVRSNILATS